MSNKINVNLNTFQDGLVAPMTQRTIKWKSPYKKVRVIDFSFDIKGHLGLSKTYLQMEKRGFSVRSNLSQFSGVEFFKGDNQEWKNQACYIEMNKNDMLILHFENNDTDTIGGIEMSQSVNFSLEVLEV